MKSLITLALMLLLTGIATPSRADAPDPLRIGISGKVRMASGGRSERSWANTKSRAKTAKRGDATRIRLCSVPPNGNVTKDRLPRETTRPRSTCPRNSIDRLN
jgi:hypothetical protein